MVDAEGKGPAEKPTLVERRGGVQLWRQIADRIRRSIGAGGRAADETHITSPAFIPS